MTGSSYLMAGQTTEKERLQLQSRLWEPAGRRLLDVIGDGKGARVVDVGCGAMGWLRLLSEWVGSQGQVVGTDIDDAMLSSAEEFVSVESLHNVAPIKDDLFATDLEPGSFDLVHARFQLVLGRESEQMDTYLRLLRPGGTVVVEDVNPGSWQCIPPAPAYERLISLLVEAFRSVGIDVPSTTQLDMFSSFGVDVNVRAEVEALPPAHPYLSLPLVFAAALREPLQSIAGSEELEQLEEQVSRELQNPDRWGLTFTLFQCWGQRAA